MNDLHSFSSSLHLHINHKGPIRSRSINQRRPTRHLAPDPLLLRPPRSLCRRLLLNHRGNSSLSDSQRLENRSNPSSQCRDGHALPTIRHLSRPLNGPRHDRPFVPGLNRFANLEQMMTRRMPRDRIGFARGTEVELRTVGVSAAVPYAENGRGVAAVADDVAVDGVRARDGFEND
jgi:hypothetical protein